MNLQPGEKLGAYEVISFLGAGGMGQVYKALDHRLGRAVAIKVLSPELVADRATAERFDIEAKSIAALSHPNILSIFEFDREEDRTFIVTELLEGEPLRARIASSAIP